MKTLLITLLSVIMLFQIKPIRILLTPLNTLIHEISHGITALALGGKLVKIKLYTSGEGEATTTSKNRLAKFLISYSGYTGAHLFVILCFYLLLEEKAELLAYIILSLLAVSWILWVRSIFGFAWTFVFFAMVLTAHLYLPLEYYLYFLYFIACVLLHQAFVTPFYLIGLSKKDKYNAGDATSMYEVTKIPPIFWALLFSAQSLATAYIIFFVFLK